MAVADWNTDPNLNTFISGINIAENCPAANINNAIRQAMADIRLFYNGTPIYKNDSSWGLRSGGLERIYVATSGVASIHGARADGGNSIVLPGSGNLRVIAATAGGIAYTSFDTQDYTAFQFVRRASGVDVQVGTITCTATATFYTTASDYRLKDIAGPVTDSGIYIDSLRPVQGYWKADRSRFIGFLAHEVQEASETIVAMGEKDGEDNQSLDYASPEMMANIIAELQSLRKRVAELEGSHVS